MFQALIPLLAKAAIPALIGAGVGAVGGKLSGQDPLKAALLGLATGGLGSTLWGGAGLAALGGKGAAAGAASAAGTEAAKQGLMSKLPEMLASSAISTGLSGAASAAMPKYGMTTPAPVGPMQAPPNDMMLWMEELMKKNGGGLG